MIEKGLHPFLVGKGTAHCCTKQIRKLVHAAHAAHVTTGCGGRLQAFVYNLLKHLVYHVVDKEQLNYSH